MKCPKCESDNTDTARFCSGCGISFSVAEEAQPPITKTIETRREELTTGSTFAGRYQIIEELGKGGMGKVYKALDTKINEKIALKLIKPEIASDKKIIERFSNELKLARKVGHRNVGRMFHLAEDAGTHYITMEYVSGEDLKSMIRMSGQLGIGTAINIAKQICEGLTEAHRMGVIHRDLKPSNIMIDKGGNARIMDFGIARSLRTKGLTGSGVMIGTPEYMSPEQVEAKDVDQRSDIYSLGVILYEMVTGRVPFVGDSPFSIGVKHKCEEPEDPINYNSRIPEDLSRVILKCLEKDQDIRYQNADGVRSELERLEQGLPTTDRVIPKKKTLTSQEVTVTFKKRWAWIAAPFVIILAAALAFLLSNDGKELPPQSNQLIIVLPFENLGPAEDENFAVGIADGIRKRLSKLHNLDVISRDTAVSYKDTGKTARQIRDETNADYILRGTVRWDKKEGEISRVRISPYLTQTMDDTQKWSDEIDRDFLDIFAVESEIAEQVTKQLDLILLPEEIQVIEVRPTENYEAYQAYLSGIDHWGLYVLKEDLQLAIQMFDLAVELDPEFALAYGYLSKSHSLLYHIGIDRTEARISKARTAVDRMLDLEPDLPETHSALGSFYYWCLKNYDQALKELSIAEKGLPNDDNILEMMGYIRRRQGDFQEAIRLSERSFELNPQDSSNALSIGASYLSLRNFPEAEHYFEKAILVDPSQPTGYIYKGLTYWLWSGDIEKVSDVIEEMPYYNDTTVVYARYVTEMVKENFQAALAILSTLSFEVVATPQGFFTKAQLMGEAYAAMGEMDLARASFDSARLLLEAEVKKSPQDPRIRSSLGLVYAALDRKEDALREGEKAMEIYPVSMDAFSGPDYVRAFAEILVRVGEYEKALEQIDYLFTIPSTDPTVADLENNPKWKPLHDHPRYKQILNKYSK